MERLEAAKKKYHASKAKLGEEKSAQDNLERGNKMAESEYKEGSTMLGEVEKEIRL